MDSKKTRKSDRTKRIIGEAIFALLENQDFEDITVNDICMEAGVGRTTFYLYYEDKYELLVKATEALIQQSFLVDIADADALTNSITQLMEMHCTLKAAFDRLVNHETIYELKVKMDNAFINHFMNLYNADDPNNEDESQRRSINAVYKCGGMAKLIYWWIQNDCAVPKEDITKYLVKNLLEAE